MSNNIYDQVRLNLPFVGICTFCKYPHIQDWNKIEADVAVMGAPFDFGRQFRSGYWLLVRSGHHLPIF